MEKIILEIERQIQRLQAAKQLLQGTRDPAAIVGTSTKLSDITAPPVKRGRGRPRKNPVAPTGQSNAA
jgi:hypothetical protein